MARNVEVRVLVDPSDAAVGFSKAGASARGFGKDIDESSRGALAASGTFKELGRSIAFASGAFLGTAGLINVLKQSIDVAEQTQKSHEALRQTMDNLGLSYKDSIGQIDAYLKKESDLSAFTQNELRDSFNRLVLATKDVNVAMHDETLAADIARARHIDLSSATQIVIKAAEGMGGQLRRLGIDVSTHANSVQLLTALYQRYHDQAQTNATASDHFHVALTNLENSVGTALLPTFNKLIGELTNWINRMESSGKIQKDVQQGLHDITDVVHGLRDAFHEVDGVTGGFKNTLELLAGLKLASVVSGWAGSFKTLAERIGLAEGTAAAGTGATGLLGTLTKLKALGTIAITIAAVDKLTGSNWLASPTTPDTLVTAKYQGQTYQAIKGTGLGDVVQRMAAGQSTTAAQRQHVLDAMHGRMPTVPSAGGGGTRYNAQQIYALLKSQGATDKEATYLTYASTHHEDPSGQISILNDNPKTGDYSEGLFQINYFGSMFASRTKEFGSPLYLASSPAAQAKAALSILRSQGPSGWPTSYADLRAGRIGAAGGSGGYWGAPISSHAAKKPKPPRFSALPLAMQEALTKASVHPTSGDYLTELEKAQSYLKSEESSVSGKNLETVLKEYASVTKQIEAIQKAHLLKTQAEERKHAAEVLKITREGNAAQAREEATNSRLAESAFKARMAALTKIVQQSKAAFTQAWSVMASDAVSAFDRQTQAGLKAIQDKYTALTPAEQALQTLQDTKAEQDNQKAIADAQVALAKAQEAAGAPPAGATAEDIAALQQGVLDAQQRLEDAQYNEQIAALQKQAKAERDAANDQMQRDQQNYTDLRDQQKQALQDQLNDLEAKLEARTTTYANANAAVLALMQQFGIDMASVSVPLPGGGSVTQNPVGDAAQAAGALGSALQAVAAQAANPPVLTAPSAYGSLSRSGGQTYYQSGKGTYGSKPMLAEGGIVRHRPGGIEVVLGEGGHDEAVIPLGGSGGGITLHANLVVDGHVLYKIVQKYSARDVARGGAGVPGS